ncbi:hypothetical protein ACFU7Y_24775 [Kitasatospora sp. NPDC057542]|uniref:hypothetical protein n=1 Tax=Streptomycetaceae TaxID=2062 RepID=UPI001CCCE98B|nr:hypothetical protein [Streptomyces sp. LS1784]
MRALRLASTVATAAVLLGAVTACGSSGGSDTKPGDTKGGDAKSGDAKVGDPLAAALAGDPKAALAASAVVMQKAGNGKVTMVPSNPDNPGGTGDADWKDPAKTAVDLAGDMGGKKLRIRVIGTDAYLGGDEAATALGGKRWVKLSSDETGDSFRAAGQMMNPVVLLTVAAQSGKLSKVGQETVDGVQTTHLRAEQDTSAVVAGMSSLPADRRQAVQKALEEDGKTLTIDFWLNGKQELVQYQEYGEKNGSKDAVTVKYANLGKAAAIAAPAAGDLGNEADLLKLLG